MVGAIEDKLVLIRYNVDHEAHIKVNQDLCRTCDHRACTFVCPAGCYTWQDEEMVFLYEGCLECGTCRIICDRGAIDWDYPRGGYGVCFRFT